MSDLPLPTPEPTLVDMVRCIERELRMRQTVYPRMVQTGRRIGGRAPLSEAAAEREIEVMDAVLDLLKKLADGKCPNRGGFCES
jgi:hypothetical protein